NAAAQVDAPVEQQAAELNAGLSRAARQRVEEDVAGSLHRLHLGVGGERAARQRHVEEPRLDVDVGERLIPDVQVLHELGARRSAVVPARPEPGRVEQHEALRPCHGGFLSGAVLAPATLTWPAVPFVTLSSGAADDVCEVLALQARAADQRPVDVRLAEQVFGILGLHRSAVLDAHRVGDPGARQIAQQAADLRMDLLRLRRGRRLPRADRPDRLVSDGAGADGVAAHAGERAAHLSRDHLPGAVRFPLLQGLAYADYGMEPRVESRPHLAVDALVGLAEVLAALAVTEDDALAADLPKHRRAHFAGDRALLLVVTVLREGLDG